MTEKEPIVGKPLIMAALTAIEGDMWWDVTRVPENLGWPAQVPFTSPCVCVCACVSVSSHCNGEEMLPGHWAVKVWTHPEHRAQLEGKQKN